MKTRLTYAGRINLIAFFCVIAMCFGVMLIDPTESHAALRAAGGSSSGGSSPGANCTNNGGVIYASAGGFVCNTSLTTDGNGNVSAGQTVVAAAVSAGATALNYVDTNIVLAGVASGNTYVQSVVANLSNGNQASADFITSIDKTTATTGYCDFGQNSSRFAGSGSLNLPYTGYVYCQNSPLTIGTAAPNGVTSGSAVVHFVTDGLATDAFSISNNQVNVFNMNGASISSGSAVSNGANVVAWGSGYQGTVAGSPYLQVGQGSGNSAGWVAGTCASNTACLWHTNTSPTSSNYSISTNGTTGGLNINVPAGGTGALQSNAGNVLQWTTSTTFLGSAVTVTNSTGAVSTGSLVANSNGVIPSAGSVGRYVPTTVASGGSSISTGSPAQAATVTLPGPGNYLITAQCDFELEASTTTITQCGIGNVTASMAVTQAGTTSGGMTIGNEAIAFNAMTTVAASGTHTVAMMPNYVQVSTSNAGSPKLFLNCQATFSAGGMRCYGSINYIQMNYLWLIAMPLNLWLAFVAWLRRKARRIASLLPLLALLWLPAHAEPPPLENCKAQHCH